MFFSGCETLHISLSNCRTIRARLNVAVMGKGSVSSHLLTPRLASGEHYEPFLYVFHCRLASLRSCIISFGDKKASASWDSLLKLHLPSAQHKILGPVKWSCQVLRWEVMPDFCVKVEEGVVLHLLSSPRKVWHVYAYQAWAEYAFAFFLTKTGHPFTSVDSSVRTWKSLWSIHKNLPPLSIKYRTFGILSGSASARIRGVEVGTCELCGSRKMGHIHTVEECPALDCVRQLPKYARIPSIPRFTRCTGVPTSQFRAEPGQVENWCPDVILSSADLFTDGSASPTDLPNVRLSAWAVIQACPDGTIVKVASGPTPGPLHNILRTETYAALVALRSAVRVNLFIDNSTVVSHLHRLLTGGFDPFIWTSGPDTDLWSALAAEIISRSPGLITVTKVKSHLDPVEATNPWDRWLIVGNSKADFWAKQALSTHSQTKPLWNPHTEWQAISDAFLASQLLHDLSDRVFALRKTQTVDMVGGPPRPHNLTLSDPRTFQVWSLQTLPSFVDETWVVILCFSCSTILLFWFGLKVHGNMIQEFLFLKSCWTSV